MRTYIQFLPYHTSLVSEERKQRFLLNREKERKKKQLRLVLKCPGLGDKVRFFTKQEICQILIHGFIKKNNTKTYA